MKRIISNLLSYVFAVSLCVGIICIVLEGVSFDVTYHMENIDVDAIRSELPISDSELQNALVKVVEYIKGDSKDMQIELDNGQKLFNERELSHMYDVQKLFILCSNIKYVCIILCMLSFICLFAVNGFYCFRFMARGCVVVLLSMIGVVILLGAWYLIDFSGFWTAFHKVAFTNDLWLMMPDDAIIILYSLEFFTAIVRRIIEQMAVIFGALFIGALLGWMLLPGKRGKKFDN